MLAWKISVMSDTPVAPSNTAPPAGVPVAVPTSVIDPMLPVVGSRSTGSGTIDAAFGHKKKKRRFRDVR